MKAARTLIWLAVIAGLLAPACLSGQDVIPAHLSNTYRLRLAMRSQRVRAGEAPVAMLTMKNLTDHTIDVGGCKTERVWVQGEHGEPPTTYRGRNANGRLLPGESPLQCTAVASTPLQPDTSITFHFDLLEYYDLHEPGRYTGYLDMPSEEGWLRTDPVAFEITAEDPAKDRKTQ